MPNIRARFPLPVPDFTPGHEGQEPHARQGRRTFGEIDEAHGPSKQSLTRARKSVDVVARNLISGLVQVAARDAMADLGTPLLRLHRWAPKREVFAKLDHLLPSGSCYDRAAPALDVDKPLVIAGWGAFVVSMAAHAMRTGITCTAVVPDDLTWEHQVLLRGFKLKLQQVPLKDVISKGAELAETLAAAMLVEEDIADALRRSWKRDWASHVKEMGADPVFLCGPAGPAFDAWADAARDVGLDVETLAAVGGPDRPAQRGSHTRCASASVLVSDDHALEVRRTLTRAEGLLVGPNSAAGLYAAANAATSRRAVALIVDAGDRYFSVDPVAEPI